MCSGLPSSRQCRSACSQHSSATCSPPAAILVSPKYSQQRDTSLARSILGDHRVGLANQRLGGHPIARRPADGRPLQPGSGRWPMPTPRASARAPARRSQGSASASAPVSMQNLAYPMPPSTSRLSVDSLPSPGASTCVDHVLPQCNRPDVQIVVAQRGGAHDAGVGAQIGVLGGEIGQSRVGPFPVAMSSSVRECGRGAFVIPERCGQAGLEALGTAGVAADHVPDVGDGHRRLVRRPPARPCRRGSTSRPPGTRGCGGRLRAPRRKRS